MFPQPFTYRAPTSLTEAIDLLAECSEQDTEILAGGQSLLPTMKAGLATPDVLIDIGNIPSLHGISHDSNTIRIGAMTPYADVLRDEQVFSLNTVFCEALAAIGDVQVRNRGTVGGNLAHADPAADLTSAALAADVTVHVVGQEGERTLPIDEFFVGMFTTAIEPHEILTQIDVPVLTDDQVGSYVKKASPASGYAMVGVAARLTVADDYVTDARIAASGATDHAIRLPAVEEALLSSSLKEAPSTASFATEGIEEWQFMDDIHASSEYRAHLLVEYCERAITSALSSL